MAKKPISTKALGTITTGIMLTHDIGEVYEAADQLLGHPVWTHEMPAYAEKMKAAVVAQIPDFPVEISADGWEATARQIADRYGERVLIERGNQERVADPGTTLEAALSQKH